VTIKFCSIPADPIRVWMRKDSNPRPARLCRHGVRLASPGCELLACRQGPGAIAAGQGHAVPGAGLESAAKGIPPPEF